MNPPGVVQVVWGDLKPENYVLFSLKPVGFELRAVDMDSACHFGKPMMGPYSLHYMPPERAKALLNSVFSCVKAHRRGEEREGKRDREREREISGGHVAGCDWERLGPLFSVV